MKILSKWSVILACLLLLFMAAFHGLGFSYIKHEIYSTNAEGFLKEIVPVLFLHPSIHLIGLAALGALTLYLNNISSKVQFLLAVLVMIDAGLAFYLGTLMPGILLTTAALLFFVAGWNKQRTIV